MPAAAPEVIRPAFLWTPPAAVDSLGDEAAQLAAALGQDVGEEERIALRALMPVRDDGRCAGLSACIIAGRRNLKSWAIEMAVLHDAFVTEVSRVVWSAHLFATTQETFRHMLGLIEGYDWLRKRVQKIRLANGEEGFDLVGGRRIDFIARQSGKSGRGQDVDRLIFDEWLFGNASMLGAMLPMMAASPNPYVRFGSSPGVLTSEALRSLRDRGRRGGDPSLSYVEWTSERMVDGRTVRPECADSECSHMPGVVDGCALDSREVVQGSNPAIPGRITWEFVENERRELPPVEFGRERAGWWEDPPTADGALDNGLPGYDLALTDRGASGSLTLGLEVSTDSRTASIGLHGGDVVEVIEYRKGAGLGWVPERVRELREAHNAPLAIRANSPAAQLLPQLSVDTVVVKSTEQAPACMSFATDMNAGDLLHRAQPVLDIAVANAVRARTGDVWRWSLSKSAEDRGTDISPLWAAVLARHIATQSTYDPDDNFFP